MKILLTEIALHKKNLRGLELLRSLPDTEMYVGMNPEYLEKEIDLVISPVRPTNAFLFKNAKCILYGPHSFTFVDDFWKRGSGIPFPPYAAYNCLSEWNKNVQDEVGGISLESVCLPFPVEVEKFQPTSHEKDIDCFLYFKHRNHEELACIQKILADSGLTFKVFTYGFYTEEEYLETLQRCKFGVWLGCHESQGFALQEALSCNVPLLVLNVKSMFDEYTKENKKVYAEYEGIYSLKATSASYWDNRCGRILDDYSNLSYELLHMKENYKSYKPREFILEILSPEACLRRLEAFVSTKGRSI